MKHSELLLEAKNGALILTSNKRLSRELISRFDLHMKDEGYPVWDTPDIISFDGWLNRSLKQAGHEWRVLSEASALRLWETVISKESSGSELELLQLGATARLAQQAYRLMVEYDCFGHSLPLTEDQKEYMRWASAYLNACASNNWIDSSERASLVYKAINDGFVDLPSRVFFVGFDQWSPNLHMFFSLQEKRGKFSCRVSLSLPSPPIVHRVLCADPDDEITSAARWARAEIDKNPHTNIGIVVLDLAQRRNRVERLVRAEIDPQSLLLQDDRDPSFTLSLGSPLIEQGAIHAAISILSVQHKLSLEDVSVLLRNPYLGGSVSEADFRAKLDSWIRSFRQQNFTLKRFIDLLKENESLPVTCRIFEAIQESLNSTTKRMPGSWGTYFDSLLAKVGWPGERVLSSHEYQVVNSWREKLLPAFASLDQVSEPISRGQALGLLKRLSGETEFQVKSATSNIQVLGQLESAGLSFDHVWVAGASEENIPSSSSPNPFLPISLQVEKGMPHSAPERELEFARNIVNRLACAAPNIIFSSPAMRGDCEVRPSPLIANFPLTMCVDTEPHDPYSCYSKSFLPLEELIDIKGPALEGGFGSGGTGLIKDQSLCPFRAFAHSRLNVRGLEPGQPGLDQRTRGDLLHNCLEKIWKDLRKQSALLSLGKNELREKIKLHIEETLAAYFSHKVTPSARVLDIERTRLQAVIEEWLQLEADRKPFTVIETEKEHYETIGPLTIKTYIDRIDELEDSKIAVIDYKTGRVKPESLIGDRLLEPQLPIYSQSGEVSAVAFANVRRGACKMLGVSEVKDMLPKVPAVEGNKKAKEMNISTWAQLSELWRSQLTQAAEDFVAGKADVDPVSPKEACEYCDLKPLCRLSETKIGFEEG